MLKSLLADNGRHVIAHSRFFMVGVAMLILSLHWAFVLYVHSTYLKEFVSEKIIGGLFVAGSGLTVLAFLYIAPILRRFGNYKLTLGLAATEFCVLIGMGFINIPLVAILLFILHQAIVPLLLFNLDVFIENITTTEERTGTKRGIVLTLMSLATALAPLGTGFLLGNSDNFSSIYFLSAACMIPFIGVVGYFFKGYPDARIPSVRIWEGIRSFWSDTDLRYVFCAHFLLQLFFTWMVIYVPLYLATVVGFEWDSIGIILFIALFAYVLFEYPIGRVADLYIGEKEMMAIGFLVLAISTCWIAFIGTPILIPWIVTLFLTRVGASFVETTTESYFFKHTKGADANIVGLFRITRPLAIVVGALLGSITLLFVEFPSMFIALGLTMILGIVFSFLIEDTK